MADEREPKRGREKETDRRTDRQAERDIQRGRQTVYMYLKLHAM